MATALFTNSVLRATIIEHIVDVTTMDWLQTFGADVATRIIGGRTIR